MHSPLSWLLSLSVSLPPITQMHRTDRPKKMSVPEIMLIMILFHSSGYRCLKHFYLNEVCGNMKDMFPNVVSYNRLTELQKVSLLPLFAFFRTQLRGKCTGISFVDSTPLRVCKNQRIRQHKVFAGFAERGCCSMGWFYGFYPSPYSENYLLTGFIC